MGAALSPLQLRESLKKVRVEGAHGSVGDCWKGLGIGSALKHLYNWEAVGVQRMLKVSKVGVG